MKTPDLLHAALRRFRQPAVWALILGFGALWIPARLLSGVPLHRIGLWEYLLPPILLVVHVALDAAPWQWTGDERPAASPQRGLLQAIPWNAAWVLLLLWGVEDMIHPPKPRPRPSQEERQPETDGPPREDRDPEDPPHPPPPGPRQEVMMLFLNIPFALALGLFLSEKERVERREDELAKRERAARGRALQSQLHPHVLFNVLSGLTELVHEDPDAAEQALVGLADLLRMLMKQGSALRLPLGQERNLLRRYLEIEAIRLGSRLQVKWVWDDTLESVVLPPLILQPLVENAIKHGIAPSASGGTLCIEGSRDGQGLHFRVSNTGRPLQESIREGTGLANLRERLALLPGASPLLDLRQEGDWTIADLRLTAWMDA